MTIINVIEIEEGVVVSISSFGKDKVQEAEELFKRIGSRIVESLDEDDLEDAVGDGVIESTSDNKAVCLTWSTLDRNYHKLTN